MLSRISPPGFALLALGVAVVAVALAACAYKPQEENRLVNANSLPPIDAQVHTQVETATFSLG